jgi:phage tail protein X
MLPERVAPPATHKIIDGDSLEQLAERYLGSASRAAELFEANRGVLARPELLPIGVELKIPRTEQASAQAATAAK